MEVSWGLVNESGSDGRTVERAITVVRSEAIGLECRLHEGRQVRSVLVGIHEVTWEAELQPRCERRQ